MVWLGNGQNEATYCHINGYYHSKAGNTLAYYSKAFFYNLNNLFLGRRLETYDGKLFTNFVIS